MKGCCTRQVQIACFLFLLLLLRAWLACALLVVLYGLLLPRPSFHQLLTMHSRKDTSLIHAGRFDSERLPLPICLFIAPLTYK